MKYLKSFEKYNTIMEGGGNISYAPDFPGAFSNVTIPSANDRTDMNSKAKDVDFQRIQTEMQEILLPYLQKHEPNADQNDAIQASDRFCSQIGEKGQKIKDIVTSCAGNYKSAAKEIIKQFRNEIIANYYRKDTNPSEQGEMSRE
jgi:hypothetical protein